MTEFANNPKQCNATLQNQQDILQVLKENVSNQVLVDEDKWDRERAFNIADSLENVDPQVLGCVSTEGAASLCFLFQTQFILSCAISTQFCIIEQCLQGMAREIVTEYGP